MSSKKVISYKNLPAKLPFFQTAVCWLALDYYQAPGWLWGVMATLFSILWIVGIYTVGTQEEVNILKNLD